MTPEEAEEKALRAVDDGLIEYEQVDEYIKYLLKTHKSLIPKEKT
jgi:hypothetical protein